MPKSDSASGEMKRSMITDALTRSHVRRPGYLTSEVVPYFASGQCSGNPSSCIEKMPTSCLAELAWGPEERDSGGEADLEPQLAVSVTQDMRLDLSVGHAGCIVVWES